MASEHRAYIQDLPPAHWLTNPRSNISHGTGSCCGSAGMQAARPAGARQQEGWERQEQGAACSGLGTLIPQPRESRRIKELDVQHRTSCSYFRILARGAQDPSCPPVASHSCCRGARGDAFAPRGYLQSSSIHSWQLLDAGHLAGEAFALSQDLGSGPQGQREHGHPL